MLFHLLYLYISFVAPLKLQLTFLSVAFLTKKEGSPKAPTKQFHLKYSYIS